jgi:hypothetical protein
MQMRVTTWLHGGKRAGTPSSIAVSPRVYLP